MRHVRIRAGDGGRVIGLDLRFTGEIGPLYIQHLHVDGFDCGIRSNWDTASLTFEHVLLEHQTVKTTPAFVVDGGHVSLAGAVQQAFNHRAWPVMVAETRDGETREAAAIGMLYVGRRTPLPSPETLPERTGY